jgi:hypothetical protein
VFASTPTSLRSPLTVKATMPSSSASELRR